jgi:predicted transcriptional regulator
VIKPTISALARDDHAKYIRRNNTDGFRLKYALGHTERRQLIKEVGIHGLVLFEYYLRLASTENALIDDEAAAEYFEWKRPTAKRHRLSLSQAGWIAFERARLSNGRRVHVYYLGKDEVEAAGLRPKSEADSKKKEKSTKPTESFILPKP